MQRRTALSLLGGSLSVALAGCLGGDDDDDDGGAVITGDFRARSVEGGWVWFGEPDEEDAREDTDLALPPSEEIPDPVDLEAELDDDGSWESTELDFPPIDVVPGIEPEIDAPDGFSGEYDEEEGLVTVGGGVKATVEDADGDPYSLEFPLNATTGQSGGLEGDFDVQDDKVVVTIVDNESVVDDTFGLDNVDDLLNLPGQFSGDNWFELTLELEPL